MTTRYEVKFENDSYYDEDICIYATSPDSVVKGNNLMSLAWICKPVKARTNVKLEWQLDYSFVWSKTCLLSPGEIFESCEANLADPYGINGPRAVNFNNEQGIYSFSKDSITRKIGTDRLEIFTGDSIPDSEVSIGIGINDNPILVVNAALNRNFFCITKLKYWIAFGEFAQGEVLELSSLECCHEINFSHNPFAKTVKTIILSENKTWHEMD